MRYVLLFFLASLLPGTLPARAQATLAPPATPNAAWLDSVQHLALPQQVLAVQQRAWRDTLLAPYQSPLCGLGAATAARGVAPAVAPAPAKPRGFPLVYVVNGYAFYNNDALTIRQLQRTIRSRPIRQVTILHDAAGAMYGTRGANGVVVLSSTKAKRP